MHLSLLAAEFNPNSIWLYLVYALIVVVVSVESIWYLVKSIKRAKAKNMDPAVIKKVITSSIVFSILPSVGVFIGVITMAGSLGIPLPAIRLSVIGAIQYELQAADWVSIELGFQEGLSALLAANAMDAETLITFAMAMSFGIIFGPLFCVFFYKKTQPKMNLSTSKNPIWADAMFASIFIGMVTAYLAVAVASIFKHNESGFALSNLYPLIALVVAALSMWLCDFFVKKKKQKWLENFSLAISMILGMTVVIVLNALV